MKNIVSVVALVASLNSLLLVGCQPRNLSSEAQQTPIGLRGTWLNVNYLTVAKEKKSALAAYKTFQSNGISLLEISGNSLPLNCLVTSDAHTGGVGILINSYSQKELAFCAGDSLKTYYTIKLDFSAGDTLLILKDLETKTERSFRRISGESVTEPFSYVFNASLFAGKYTVLDSLGNKLYSDVLLKENGAISDFALSKTYQVWVDYAADPATNPCDWITFDNGGLEYEFKGRDIYLYTRAGESEDDAHRGSLKFTFVRQ
jgi:hypothetical protein